MPKLKIGIFIAIIAVQYLAVSSMVYAGGDLSNPGGEEELPEDCQEYYECPRNYSYCTEISEQSEPGACMEYSERYIGQYKIVSCEECAEGYSMRVASETIPCGSYTYTICGDGSESEELYCPAGSYSTGSYCADCPTATNLYTNSALTILARGTSYEGSTAQSECFLAAGTYYDVSGTLSISSNCQY